MTEITYGDKVDLSKLYSVIDADTKEKIGVPWAVAPTFVLKDKYSEKIVNEGAAKTETLDAGEYVYGIWRIFVLSCNRIQTAKSRQMPSAVMERACLIGSRCSAGNSGRGSFLPSR